MFERLIHADWGVNPKKRWVAVATRTSDGWLLEAVERMPDSTTFLDEWLFDDVAVLAGFDFPIGLPAVFGEKTSFAGFMDALAKLGRGEWHEFFQVAQEPNEISIHRPFYPDKPRKGSKRDALVQGLEISQFEDLLRECERKTEFRRAACPLFWTLGGNQVGKGAICGWEEIVRPALRRGANLWPFQGPLSELSKSSGCVICETYPGEAYRHLEINGKGKRKQATRLEAGKKLKSWAQNYNVALSPSVLAQLFGGFGPSSSGEDAFDAFVGVASMIEVAQGRRREGTPLCPDQMKWEGWILGQEHASPP